MGLAGPRPRNGRAGQPTPGPDRIGAAMFWLANCLIDGFAAYGHALYPSFTDMGHAKDLRGWQWSEKVQGRDEFASPPNNPWRCEANAPKQET